MIEALYLPTDREAVELRALRLGDAAVYFEAIDHSRQHLSQFGDVTARKYQSVDDVRLSIEHPGNPRKQRFGIWDAEQFVGSINLTPKGDEAEIGYWIDARHTRQGYASAAANALARYAKSSYNNVYADVAIGNTASENTLKRAGFVVADQFDGRTIFWFV